MLFFLRTVTYALPPSAAAPHCVRSKFLPTSDLEQTSKFQMKATCDLLYLCWPSSWRVMTLGGQGGSDVSTRWEPRLTRSLELLQQNIVFHYYHFVVQTLDLNFFRRPLGLQEGTVVVKGHLHLMTQKLWPPRGDHNSGTHAVLMRKIHTNVEWDKTMGWHFISQGSKVSFAAPS